MEKNEKIQNYGELNFQYIPGIHFMVNTKVPIRKYNIINKIALINENNEIYAAVKKYLDSYDYINSIRYIEEKASIVSNIK